MAEIVCPHCALRQEDAADCRNCGIIFARYRSRTTPTQPSRPAIASPHRGFFLQSYRVVRWLALAALILVAVLILRRASPPQVDTDPDAGQRVESKLKEAHNSMRIGRAHRLQLGEAEVNSWLTGNLPPSPASHSSPAATDPTASQEVQTAMHDIKIDLREDLLLAYVLFDFHGQDLSLILEGRLRVTDGYIRLEPTGGTLGSLPLPAGLLNRAVARLFESSQNREKLRLPAAISDMHVENGELVVSFMAAPIQP